MLTEMPARRMIENEGLSGYVDENKGEDEM